jgi:sugar/nucleoside kinase (ribokinase family)
MPQSGRRLRGEVSRAMTEGREEMYALGYTARDAFSAALEACKEHGVRLLIVDSLGPALHGDAEAARDVIERALKVSLNGPRTSENLTSRTFVNKG